MEAVKYFREGDQPSKAVDGASDAVDLSPLLGTWTNTWQDTKGFVKLVISNRDGKLVLRAYGARSPELCDWGEAEAVAYSDGVDNHRGKAISAFYDTGDIEVALQGNLNIGLLVVVTFNRFKDGSGRANYINREFFHR